jgi:hypothetical protein
MSSTSGGANGDTVTVSYEGVAGSKLLDYKVRVGSWVSRGQVIARAEGKDGKVSLILLYLPHEVHDRGPPHLYRLP